MPIVQIVTKRGHAVITLNEGWFLCVFYANGKSVGSLEMPIRNSKVLYDNGWRLDLLQWFIEQYEPRVKLP